MYLINDHYDIDYRWFAMPPFAIRRAISARVDLTHREAVMFPQVLVCLVGSTPEVKPAAIAGLIKRARHARSTSALSRILEKEDKDPYLLIMLADQELVDGREQQARSLVEAAYNAFDQHTRANVYTLSPRRLVKRC